MTVHRPHPLFGEWLDHVYADPDNAILFDGCDRCADQAADPFRTLDTTRIGDLWRRMIDVEGNDGHYRTAAEGRACRLLYGVLCMIERTHPGVDPWTWPWTTRWAVSADRSLAAVPTEGFESVASRRQGTP